MNYYTTNCSKSPNREIHAASLSLVVDLMETIASERYDCEQNGFDHPSKYAAEKVIEFVPNRVVEMFPRKCFNNTHTAARFPFSTKLKQS